LGVNPYAAGLTVKDCGDVPVTPFDKAAAIKQVAAAYRALLRRPVATPHLFEELNMQKGLDNLHHPRLVALGGDHTIVSGYV
jgi:agmatinase